MCLILVTLNSHSEIPNALVATPIAEWTTDHVWDYLIQNNPPPWGQSHDFMLKLYRQASGDECPFILDLLTPSCGGSRFGCWTCTVVKKDLSMQGFIRSGEEWMQPLNNFRNWLKEIREDPQMRMQVRRNKTKGPGPFTPEARKTILKNLFDTEQEVGILLISNAEISYIQNIWSQDFDLGETAIELSNKYDKKIEKTEEIKIQSKEKKILDSLMADYELSPDLITKLLYLVSEKYPSMEIRGAKRNLQKDIADALEKAITQEELADPNYVI
ncbi:Rossmann-like alpha/beta/alpha sandwich fold-containing [Desulfonema limicola]|uniref:Rossmann-like alpha/beta/alpha sandwich fold-containing n=1 Tax=Desulfonema limicola TaxID=45656 RepID=A0A975GF79_9BACT|nr:hypothetical protein [Desulfonema limicola]QTA78899.1 Rossmann-like alpha/beta/alpha sandwich fold-containing [Desulfonema limicola]